MSTRKIGRDANSGRFVTIRQTRLSPSTTVIETVSVSRPGIRRNTRRRAVSKATAEEHTCADSEVGSDL